MSGAARAGLIGAVLLFLGLALLSALAVQPFRSHDEGSHVAYAIAVGHGTIPRTNERARPLIPGEPTDAIYTANHPPLYYALVTGPLLFGIHIGHPLLGLYLARIESALFSAGTVALTAVLAFTLLDRRRPEIAVAAAALTATTGAFVYSSSLVYNDSLATLLAVTVLIATFTLVRNGPRPAMYAALVVAAAAAVTTRASNATVVGIAAAGVLAAGVIHHRVRRAVLVVGAMGVACFAAGGWFYLLNQARYGHLTGHTLTPNPPRSIAGFLLSPWTYTHLVEETYGDLSGVAGVLAWSNGLTVNVLRASWLVMAAGLMWWARRPPRLRGAPANRVVVGLVVLHCLACLLYVSWWAHIGGYPHIRYLFPALPVLAVVLARALIGLPGGRVWAAVVVSAQAAIALPYLAILPAQWTGNGVWTAFPAALDNAGVPVPALVVGLLLALAGCGWALCLRGMLAAAPADQSANQERALAATSS